MPNYNHSEYLPKSLGALVNRERCPDEVIVIDDGSTDNSWEIIQEFARKHPHIRAYKNEKNMGPMYTVDRALNMATGDFVYSGAADDFVLPGFFEKCMAVLAEHPEAGLCCTVGHWEEMHTGLVWHMGVGMTDKPAYLSPERMMELERKGRLFIAGHTVIVKRSALLEVGKFPAAVKYGGDWYTYNLIGFHLGICVVPEPLAVFQIHPKTYYNRGRQDKQDEQLVMAAVIRLWGQEKWQDSIKRMKDCGALYIWGYAMLRYLVTHREHWHYLNLTFLRKNLMHIVKLLLKRMLPSSVTNWLAGLAGYRAKAR